ncbi:helix-turn-helix domain-containing protein [Phormidesmis sp. 146-35]
MTSNMLSPLGIDRQANKSLILSSQQMGWNGILVEQYQILPTSYCEASLPALSAHWLNFPLGQPMHLTQKRDNRLHESIFHKGDLIFVPAGQPSYWRSRTNNTPQSILRIYLQPELVTKIVEASALDFSRLDLTHSCSKSALHLHQIAVMLLAELESGGIMGELYVESLTQVLIIELLRHCSSSQTITSAKPSLTHTRLQSAIDYIHAHLDLDLTLVQIATSINISPSHFASLFKQATGISLHQYVIKQRVERAKLLLTTTDLPIASIAFQVGFSSQSHLNQHCKRLTGMTPKQLSKIGRIC